MMNRFGNLKLVFKVTRNRRPITGYIIKTARGMVLTPFLFYFYFLNIFSTMKVRATCSAGMCI